ncbi:MAG TPA: hypothetical protein VFI02_17995 [Armatimonadota bacterium]|nr:hypothetical protein [Armatimonadota bacterium]
MKSELGYLCEACGNGPFPLDDMVVLSGEYYCQICYTEYVSIINGSDTNGSEIPTSLPTDYEIMSHEKPDSENIFGDTGRCMRCVENGCDCRGFNTSSDSLDAEGLHGSIAVKIEMWFCHCCGAAARK